ncbi:protein-L-isoaspartate(D-aspartate) O-methyltransferase [Plasticicumulans acidivorans]|uniref:Protein-L-isoaspartate O-methyltransferase n=1 Tax=Plasticicumulans acidivorans TaxID=886464 RepID=A0A317MXX4_9GAMM|nr:protein-L-isoaspartate(D-aspartate) O-methyltransferase [Plasticicumulans acidivorans]PWV63487.1 protein-L-isoaspartate(D-aspartate) O-methyltransferase [Plasticicumulans acidivorans]
MTSARTRTRLLARLREMGITHESVLAVIGSMPRHLFVEEALASRAYENMPLPIGFGQTISQPYIVALMTQAAIEGRSLPLERVLEVGTGSGYQAAVLASLVQRVWSVERLERLAERARSLLASLGLRNVRLKHDDGMLGWPEYGPFDAILVTAAGGEVPQALLTQLTIGGRLIAPIGPPGIQQLVCIERKAIGFETRNLGAVTFVPLLAGVQ